MENNNQKPEENGQVNAAQPTINASSMRPIDHIRKSKQDLIDEYASQGWQIIDGNNKRLNTRKKWKSFQIVKLYHSDYSKKSEKSSRIIWAVRPMPSNQGL
jgi:hypothetical protein